MAEAEINARSGAGGGAAHMMGAGGRSSGLYAYPLTLGSRGAPNQGRGSEPEGDANFMKYLLCSIRNSSIPGSMQYTYANQSVALPIPMEGLSTSYQQNWGEGKGVGLAGMGAIAFGGKLAELAGGSSGAVSQLLSRNVETMGMIESWLAGEAGAAGAGRHANEFASQAGSMGGAAKRSALMQKVVGAVTGGATANSFNAGFGNNVMGGVMQLPGISSAAENAQYNLGLRSIEQQMMSYGGPGFRQFNFNYRLKPQSPEEMTMIEGIIKWFKYYSAPVKWSNEITRVYELPGVFKIKFYTGINENTHMNKIGYCALTSLNVKYGGNKFQTFVPDNQGAAPVETSIQLTFKELEIVVRSVADASDRDPTVQSGY